MPNPFLEGAPHDRMIRILEFSAEHHTLSQGQGNPLPWLTVPISDAHQLLEDAFFDSSVATQSYVVKALTLLRIFDGYSPQRLRDFINRARASNQAAFITDLLNRLEAVDAAGVGLKT